MSSNQSGKRWLISFFAPAPTSTGIPDSIDQLQLLKKLVLGSQKRKKGAQLLLPEDSLASIESLELLDISNNGWDGE